jgi:hypothetical protein
LKTKASRWLRVTFSEYSQIRLCPVAGAESIPLGQLHIKDCSGVMRPVEGPTVYGVSWKLHLLSTFY